MSSSSTPAKNAQREFFLLACTYTAVIAGVLWWASRVAGPSVYDRSITRLEGASITVTDAERSRKFFQQVLDFRPMPNENAILLPDRHKIFLDVRENSSPGEVYLDIRNGLQRLHAALKKRGENFDGVAITEIDSQRDSEQFEVTDFDGNRFIFRKSRNKFFPKARKAPSE